MTKRELISKMKHCPQTKTQNVLEHGYSVWRYMKDLLDYLKLDKPLKRQWKLPEWVDNNKELLINNLPDEKTLKLALIFHDCGKPFCRTIDSEGNQHFPDHAKVSYDTFIRLFNNEDAAQLILHDMDIHLLKTGDIEEFLNNPNYLTHLLIGLSEIHSNSNMFGGIESTSFKIKWKSIQKIGKKLIEKSL